jgi:hypothetical protein
MNESNKKWLLDQARLHSLTNGLGFVVTLAREVAARSGDTTSARYEALLKLKQELRESRLDREDTLAQASLSQREREWLRETRPQAAAEWHLLTD